MASTSKDPDFSSDDDSDDDNYNELQKYFTTLQWDNMGIFERKRQTNILLNYQNCISLGLPTDTPEFVVVFQRRQEQNRKRPKSILKSALKQTKSSENVVKKRVKFADEQQEEKMIEEKENKSPPVKPFDEDFLSQFMNESCDSNGECGIPYEIREKMVQYVIDKQKWIAHQWTMDKDGDFVGFPEDDGFKEFLTTREVIENAEYDPDDDFSDDGDVEMSPSEQSESSGDLLFEPPIKQNNDHMLEDTRNNRYPLRRRTAVNYNLHQLMDDNDFSDDDDVMSTNIQQNQCVDTNKPSDVDHIWCYGCKDYILNGCPQHPLLFISDNEVNFRFIHKYVLTNDKTAVRGTSNYARDSCPLDMVSVGNSEIDKKGIWTDQEIEEGIVFGPYDGVILCDRQQSDISGYAWEITKDGSDSIFVDGRSQEFGNWMRFVNHGDRSTSNVVAFQWNDNIWYMVIKLIDAGIELLVHYGDQYEQDLLSNATLVKPKVTMETATASSVYECKDCGRAFSSESFLSEHMERYHLDHSFQCPHCDYAAAMNSSLNTHIRDIHGDGPIKSHVCQYCQKAFQSAYMLARHIRIHTGEKPFKCNTCGKEFKDKSTLTKHERIHSGDQPFACKVCGKTFNQSVNLRTHHRIHTGQKPYKCKFCDFRSTHSNSRIRHELRNHPEKVQ